MNIKLYRSDIQKKIIDIQQKKTTNSDEALALCDELEKYGLERKEDALVGYARFTRGEIYYSRNDIPNFYKDMMDCMEPYKKIREWGYLVMANITLGIMSMCRGNYATAMEYYDNAMDYCKRYKLPDLAWMVHMNLGNIYMVMAEYDIAGEHYMEGLGYLEEHEHTVDRQNNLAVAYLGLSKCSMYNDNMEAANKYARLLRNACLPDLTVAQSLPVYCYFARLFHKDGQDEITKACFVRVRNGFTDDIPIMDVFDDLYQYMKLLLEMEEYEEFIYILSKAEQIAGKTTVKNLLRKLKTLRIRYDRKVGDEEALAKDAIAYFDLIESMNLENTLMTKQTTEMRRSITQLEEEKEDIQKENIKLTVKSETDPLTGMFNRMRLNSYGEVAFERALKNQTGIAVEILDIDFFKEYNDNYGHQEGDKCIQFIADELMALKKYGGVFVSRYGGDEFVVLYENYTEKEVFSIAKNLKKSITDKKFEHKYSKVQSKIVTISQGIYWGVPQEGQTVWNYLHDADRMLYKVKRKSRNSILLGHATDENDHLSGSASERGQMVPLADEDPKGEVELLQRRYEGNPEDEEDTILNDSWFDE